MGSKLLDFYLHEYTTAGYIATPALTVDGVQDSDAKATTTANVDITVFQARLHQLLGDTDSQLKQELKGLYFNLEAFLKAVSTATADLKWKWQAKNAASTTWVDLHAVVSDDNIDTTYLSRVRKGFIRPQTNLNSLPIDVRLLLQANELNEGSGKVRNTSFVTVEVVE